MDAYRAFMNKLYPKLPADDGFVYNYWQGAHALVIGLEKSHGAVGPALVRALPRAMREPFQISNNGFVHLDSRRQAIQDQYQLQLVKQKDGSVAPQVVAFVPNVDQSFGGLFKPSSPPPGRTQPPCKRVHTPWQGKIKVVLNGKVTNQVIK
jgi:branched-chain amino acid transport system substrate-binding protein